MDALLLRYFNPDFLSADVKAEASAADLTEFDARLLDVRLQIELRRRDFQAAQNVMRLMEALPLGKDRLFGVATARLMIAHMQNDKPAFMVALDAWLDGRAKYPDPDIWNNVVLEQPEIAGWLAEVDPVRIAPLPRKTAEIGAEDRAFVKDLDIDAACLAAVTENREWLDREVLIFGSPEALAKQYRLISVLRSEVGGPNEAMMVTDGWDMPSFMLALDEQGRFAGSYIAH